MPQDRIEMHKAATSLYNLLREKLWFHSVGLGQSVLYVTVKSEPQDFDLREWEGYCICLRRCEK